MSALQTYHLRCDADGCDERFVPFHSQARASTVRQLATEQGWRHGVKVTKRSGPSPSYDFCPRHRDELDEVLGGT